MEKIEKLVNIIDMFLCDIEYYIDYTTMHTVKDFKVQVWENIETLKPYTKGATEKELKKALNIFCDRFKNEIKKYINQ